MRSPILSALALTLLSGAILAVPATAAEVTLQNDSFVSGQTVSIQGLFGVNEIAASRFVLPPGMGPWRVNRVQFLLAGDNSTVSVALVIWDDAAGTATPGTELFNTEYLVTGSESQWQEIDVTADNVQVTAQFRVGIKFLYSGLPSIPSDLDGILPNRNFIYAVTPITGWFEAGFLGVSGDWIIRAVVEEVPTLDVPEGGALALSLSLLGANPSPDGRLRLGMTLPSDAPAQLDVIDVSGRRVLERDLGTLGTGRHAIGLDALQGAPAGMYLVRLRQGTQVRTVRAVLLD